MSYRIESPNHWPITIPDATTTSDGVMSAADKAKLDGMGGIVTGVGAPVSYPIFLSTQTSFGASSFVATPSLSFGPYGLSAQATNPFVAGNLIIVAVRSRNSTAAATCSDTLGTVYTLAASANSGVGTNMAVFYGVAPSTGGATVTVAGVAASGRDNVTCYQVKNTTGVLNAVSSATSSFSTVLNVATPNSYVVGLISAYVQPAASLVATPGPSMSLIFAGPAGTVSFGAALDTTLYEYGQIAPVGPFNVSYSRTGAGAPTGDTLVALAFDSAPVVPSPGVDGDYYVDTYSRLMFGPRTAGAYSLVPILS